MLTKPGATNSPVTSTSDRARSRPRLPTRAMWPSRIATSALYRGRPVPSITVPWRRIRSYRGSMDCAASPRMKIERTPAAAQRHTATAERCDLLTPPPRREGAHDLIGFESLRDQIAVDPLELPIVRD